jgi:hypothetical protein
MSRDIGLDEQIEAVEAARAFLSIGSADGNDLCVALRAAAASLRGLQSLPRCPKCELRYLHDDDQSVERRPNAADEQENKA